MDETHLTDRLAFLAQLHSVGTIDDREFALAKMRLLDEALGSAQQRPPPRPATSPLPVAPRATGAAPPTKVAVAPRTRKPARRHARPRRWVDTAVSVALGAVIVGILTLTVVVGLGSAEAPGRASADPAPDSAQEPDTGTTTPAPPPPPLPPADFTAPSADGLVSVVPDPGTAWAAPVSAGVVQTLHSYFAGINSGDYATAYAVLTPQTQERIPLARFRSLLTTSRDSAITVHSVSPGDAVVGVHPVEVAVTFTSDQAPGKGPAPGETCTRWDLTYRLVPSGQTYLIDEVTPTTGVGHTPC
jgi:hypothetical protein